MLFGWLLLHLHSPLRNWLFFSMHKQFNVTKLCSIDAVYLQGSPDIQFCLIYSLFSLILTSFLRAFPNHILCWNALVLCLLLLYWCYCWLLLSLFSILFSCGVWAFAVTRSNGDEKCQNIRSNLYLKKHLKPSTHLNCVKHYRFLI